MQVVDFAHGQEEEQEEKLTTEENNRDETEADQAETRSKSNNEGIDAEEEGSTKEEVQEGSGES